MRCRWLEMELSTSIRTLSKKLSLRTLTPDAPAGFIVDRVRDEFLEARYIERYQHHEKIVDPFGNEIEQERVEYRKAEFRVAAGSPGLEIYNSPKSAQGLISALNSASDYSLSISPLRVNPARWAQSYLKKYKIDGNVVSAQISGVKLKSDVTAKAVVSGFGDVIACCDLLAGSEDYTFDRVQLKLALPKRGAIVLTSSGAARVSTSDPHGIIGDLRSSLPVRRAAGAR